MIPTFRNQKFVQSTFDAAALNVYKNKGLIINIFNDFYWESKV